MSAVCERCGIPVPGDHNFCGACGHEWQKEQRELALKERRERVGRNKAFAVDMLTRCDVKFTVKNDGEHVIVADGNPVDYWPGTGLFIQRRTKKSGRGIYNLLKLIGVKAPKEYTP